MIIQRVFAVLAALLLVGSIALATLGPPGLPLGQALFMLNHDVTLAVQMGIEQHVATWLWRHVAVPLMLRPAWMFPAALGLICAGLAMTFVNRKPARRSHRRS